MKVSMIAAVAKNGVIGRDNQLPFRQRDDMRFFVRTTKGHTVITGRRNFDAMGRPLPGRRNLVVTRDRSRTFSGAETVTSVAEALRLADAAGESEAFIIGGAEIYALAFPYAHVFYRTRVLSEIEGDIYFPEIDLSDFVLETLTAGKADQDNEFDFVIEQLTRKSEPMRFDLPVPS
jgi:dihydrofolate reductase